MLAKYIDHTLLAAQATATEIEKLCTEAKQYGFASVCVQPYRVALAKKILQGSEVAVVTVVGFPHGANGNAKVVEAKKALEDGADEIDMVLNLGALKDGDWQIVGEEIQLVKNAIGEHILKVILETGLLSEEEIVKACQVAQSAGADFVKTSTGFAGSGAQVKDIQLMKETVGDTMGVKASGGIRDRETAQAMIDAGATRIGASASVQICTE